MKLLLLLTVALTVGVPVLVVEGDIVGDFDVVADCEGVKVVVGVSVPVVVAVGVFVGDSEGVDVPVPL